MINTKPKTTRYVLGFFSINGRFKIEI